MLLVLYQHYLGLPKERVIGTGALLDTTHVKRAVAERFGVDARSVTVITLANMEIHNLRLESSSCQRQPISNFTDQATLEKLHIAS